MGGFATRRPPVRPKLDPFIGIIDRILEEDKDRPKKQRHTSKRIFERLRDEYGFTGKITIVKDYICGVRQRRREMFVFLAIELAVPQGRDVPAANQVARHAAAGVERRHQPGAVGHVDMRARMQSVDNQAVVPGTDLAHYTAQIDGAPTRPITQSRQEFRRPVTRVRLLNLIVAVQLLMQDRTTGHLDRDLASEILPQALGIPELRRAREDHPYRSIEIHRVGGRVVIHENEPSLPREHPSDLSIGVPQPQDIAAAEEIGFDPGAQVPPCRGRMAVEPEARMPGLDSETPVLAVGLSSLISPTAKSEPRLSRVS